VRTAFSARRKTLRKALAPLFNDEDWQRLGVNPGLRPQNLTLADYVMLANDLHDEQEQTGSDE